jgi:hypothetical protein
MAEAGICCAFREILAIAIPVLRLNLQTTDTKIL